jgi:putative hemolysin
MDDPDPFGRQLLLQLALIAVNAVFACAEIACLSLNHPKIEKQAAKGDRVSRRLVALTREPERFLATIQVGITLAGFLASAFAANNFSGKFGGLLSRLFARFRLPVAESQLKAVSVVIITVILSFFTLVLGELLPKRLAMKKADQIARTLSGFLVVSAKIFAPAVTLLSISTNALLRLLRLDPNEDEQKVTEEDIRILVDSGGESGAIREAEQEIINNIFEFDNKSAGEVMTHRSRARLLWLRDDDETWEKTVIEGGHSRYPVCGETFDEIVGVLETRAYLMLDRAERTRKTVLEKAVKPAVFMPETQKADVLFRNMKKNRCPFVIVLDEYGGTSGIVTMFDLLEAIVGELE